MAYIIAIAIALGLFFGFLLLTRLETSRGARFFGRARAKLDERVGKAAFVVSHVDWSAFTGHLVRTVTARIAHDVAHASLIIVRIVERLLTRMVKYLRSSRPHVAPVADKPRFDMQASLAQFKSKRPAKTQETEEIV